MSETFIILFLSWIAGFTAFIGGFTAKIEWSTECREKSELIQSVIAFGGGILLAAVAFSLVPEGIHNLSPLLLGITFCSGGIIFCIIDEKLSKRGGSKAQLMAMVMDFIPEAVGMGALFGQNKKSAMLLAVFIGAQNLPEGFNSFRELIKGGVSQRKTLAALFLISFLGPVAAASGYFFLQNIPGVTAGIMSFAAGGILYLIFEDIAPESVSANHWKPPLGAVFGFMLGILGKQYFGI